MRYLLAIFGGVTIGLVANQALGQVAAMGGMGTAGGMGNPSVAAGNMNLGASTSSLGGNGSLGGVRSSAGGGYGATTQASVVGSNMAAAGGYPTAAAEPRYSGQNYSTIAGSYGTAAAMANQPGQPFALNRSRSMFAGAVGSSTSGVRSRYNRRGYIQPTYSQPGYAPQLGYGAVATMVAGSGPASLFGNGNMSVASNPVYNGVPSYTYGLSFPAGYAPYRATQVSSPVNYQPSNEGLPGYTYGRSYPAGYAPYQATQISSPVQPTQISSPAN